MFYVGDDVAEIYPVTDTSGGTLSFTPTVRATTGPDDDSTPVQITGEWQGTAQTVPDTTPAATRRELEVPLAALPHGLWSLRLVIDGAGDLFLGNVYIE